MDWITLAALEMLEWQTLEHKASHALADACFSIGRSFKFA
jgi:hypothetical protein